MPTCKIYYSKATARRNECFLSRVFRSTAAISIDFPAKFQAPRDWEKNSPIIFANDAPHTDLTFLTQSSLYIFIGIFTFLFVFPVSCLSWKKGGFVQEELVRLIFDGRFALY